MTISAIGGTSGAWPTSQAQRPPRPDDALMTSAAQALGVSADDLKTKLASGQSLADVAQAQGVSTDDLASKIAASMKADKPADAPDLSDDQLAQIATSMVQRKGGPHHGGHHGHGGPPPVSAADATGTTDATGATASLTSTAQSLGLDPSELLAQLQQGDDSALTSSGGASAYGAGLGTSGSGLLVDQYA